MLPQGYFFRNEEIFKKEIENFRKFFDSEGATELLLRLNHFINATV